MGSFHSFWYLEILMWYLNLILSGGKKIIKNKSHTTKFTCSGKNIHGVWLQRFKKEFKKQNQIKKRWVKNRSVVIVQHNDAIDGVLCKVRHFFGIDLRNKVCAAMFWRVCATTTIVFEFWVVEYVTLAIHSVSPHVLVLLWPLLFVVFPYTFSYCRRIDKMPCRLRIIVSIVWLLIMESLALTCETLHLVFLFRYDHL